MFRFYSLSGTEREQQRAVSGFCLCPYLQGNTFSLRAKYDLRIPGTHLQNTFGTQRFQLRFIQQAVIHQRQAQAGNAGIDARQVFFAA